MSGPIRHLWGWVLLMVGIIGLIMPIMPGWIFLIPGLVILSDYFPWAHRLLQWAKEKAGFERRGEAGGQAAEEKDGGASGRDGA